MSNFAKFLLIYFVLFCFEINSFSQNTFNLNGFIEDAKTGEIIIGASVFSNKTASITNSYGYYSINLPANDTVTVYVSVIGFENNLFRLCLTENKQLDIKMVSNTDIDEVIISANKQNKINNTISSVQISVKDIKLISALAGETDVLRAFQLMPGVQSGSEGTSGLYVRGGSPDQNLILLDGVPLYYVNHIGGFVSVFDVNAIKSVELIKGAFPAQYGGRLSSVMDIRLKDGNMNEKHGNFTIGLLSSKFSFEGPIKKDTSSFIISARRCNVDLLTRPISWFDLDLKGNAGYTFWDINAKINKKIGSKDRLFFSVYVGRDKVFVNGYEKGTNSDNIPYKYNYDFNIKWGNFPVNFRWNHVFSSNLFSNMNLSLTHFFYNTKIQGVKKNENSSAVIHETSSTFNSGITDFIFKEDFDWYPVKNHAIKFGGAGIYHIFNPGISRFVNSNNIYPDTTKKINAFESFVYIKDKFKIFKRINADIGIHLSSYSLPNEKTFFSAQPRIAVNININPNTAFKSSFVMMQQHIHLLSSSNVGFPTDLWVPATIIAPPEKSMQVSGGIIHFFSGKYEINIETYYKEMHNLIDFKEGSSFYSGKGSWEEKTETGGNGISYGAELLLKKKSGKLTGWLSYTISKNERTFEHLNNGQSFPYNFDRRHDISLVLNYVINKKLTLSGTFVYMSGKPVTLATNSHGSIDPFSYDISNSVHLYNGKNSYRLPAYHRADISLNSTKKIKRGIRSLSFSIYNFYNHQNPFFVFYKNEVNKGKVMKLYQLSLFPIIPSLSYSLAF